MTAETARMERGRAAPESLLAAMMLNREVQDGLLAAFIVGSRLPSAIGAPGAAVMLLLSALYLALRLQQSRDTLARCWPQLAVPVLALLSVIWAIHPVLTLRGAIQMAITAWTGLMLSQAERPRAVLVGLFLAYAGYSVASLLVGHTRLDGIEAFPALIGWGGEAKNFFADTAGTGVLLSLTMVPLCLEKRSFSLAAATSLIAVVCALATIRAHSAGAVASLVVSVMLLGVLLVLRRRSQGLKFLFAAALVAAFVLGIVLFQPLLALVQEMSAKDAGLTGRGYLWYRADFVIAQRPWLGMGYFGFWTPSNPDAIGLWHYFKVRQEGTGFSFHNSYIQTIVETGYLGLGVLLASWIAGVLMLLRRFVLVSSLPTCFWLSYMALQLSKSPVEIIRPGTLIAPTVMLYIALGFGCFPIRRIHPRRVATGRAGLVPAGNAPSNDRGRAGTRLCFPP